MFGIPYATGEFVGGVLHRVCPVCGERVPEAADADGEQTTNNYAEHYEGEHTDVCVFCESAITESPVDHAWEDESGACGCGETEHLPHRVDAPFLKAAHEGRCQHHEGE